MNLYQQMNPEAFTEEYEDEQATLRQLAEEEERIIALNDELDFEEELEVIRMLHEEDEEDDEHDPWGLPCRDDDEFGKEKWNPSDEDITKFWKEFWERVMKG